MPQPYYPKPWIRLRPQAVAPLSPERRQSRSQNGRFGFGFAKAATPFLILAKAQARADIETSDCDVATT